MGLNIGIDLGTTYSVVAYVDNGSAKIIQTSQDSVTTASAVYLEEDGTLTIGQEAKQEQKYHGQVATFYKRNIGSDSKDYDLENGRSYSAVDLSSIFLKELVKRVEEKMHQKVDGAVITVPAYFTDHERSNTRKAAERAGIHVLHMINEPTAAAIAYGLDKSDNKKILVYDLGGKDWDIAICKWAAEQFAEEYGEDFSYDKEQMDALMVDAETLKRNLTNKSQADIRVNYNGSRGSYTLTEAEFRKRTRPLVEHTGKLIQDMFAETGLSWNDIDDVILVGGSTRMTMIEDYITELQGKPALRGVNADEAVALGAAITADSIAQSIQNFSLDGQVGFEISAGNKTVKDVISHSLGLIAAREENQGDVLYRTFYNEIMIPRNTVTQQATMTKQFRLNSNTQDIYLTQWESESLPEESAIIGKYQTMGITPNQPFSVTYFHNPDGTVNITAEQSGKQLRVQKVLECADRTFEPEKIQMPSHGAIVIAIDLSGSMSSVLNQAKDFIYDFVKKFSSDAVSIGMVGFASREKKICDLTNDRNQFRSLVRKMEVGDTLGYGTSANPMDHAYQMLKAEASRKTLKYAYTIVLTDGEWTSDAARDAISDKKKYVASGFEIVAQGFGDANEKFIKNLATRTDLSGVGNLSNLGYAMTNIAQVLNSSH